MHLIGTYEKVEEEEEEIYEVINVHKLKSATPNLRVINLYGINFIDDSHIDAFSSNCIQVWNFINIFGDALESSEGKLLIECVFVAAKKNLFHFSWMRNDFLWKCYPYPTVFDIVIICQNTLEIWQMIRDALPVEQPKKCSCLWTNFGNYWA